MAIGVRQGTDKTSPCEACVKGKHSRKPFQSTGARRTKDLLELIHSDVCGTMPTASIGGAKYFVTFIDDFTRYCFIYFMNSKTKVVEKFKELKRLIENQLNKRIKALRTDNGLEYVNSHLSRILKNNGIIRGHTSEDSVGTLIQDIQEFFNLYTNQSIGHPSQQRLFICFSCSLG